jgi:hypothetical protein
VSLFACGRAGRDLGRSRVAVPHRHAEKATCSMPWRRGDEERRVMRWVQKRGV